MSKETTRRRESHFYGPKVYLCKGYSGTLWHCTGGFRRPTRAQTFCGRSVKGGLHDPRNVVPRENGTNPVKYCMTCLGLLENEALDQLIHFAPINFGPNGTFGATSIVPVLKRRQPLLLGPTKKSKPLATEDLEDPDTWSTDE
tara:strand:+ start:357 stop:785 length:429 start_codon:yes stop_codon:yes gene_type:complete